MKARRHLLLVVILTSAVGLSIYRMVKHQKVEYPYGVSHCCIDAMELALNLYAQDHGGAYPAGESSPEASLSLLCKSNYTDAGTIRGMTVPESSVRGILERGGLLGPQNCGWQYVEGLTPADDPRMALLYCKEPLGHNGQRTKDGGRQVLFAGNGGIQWISGDQWPSFLSEQRELLRSRNENRKESQPSVH